ncbi:FYVE zinc finger-domain-containing protein [Dipodascopsis uninucleata]
MDSHNGISRRERSFSPAGRDSISPVPSITSLSSLTSSTVVETLRNKKNHSAQGPQRSRRVIGGDGFRLSQEPPKSASYPVSAAPHSDGVDGSGDYSCPICNESMSNMTQLNRHLDNVHQDIQSNDNVSSRLMKYISKAKNFTPVQALNSTLAYADLSDLGFTVGPEAALALSPPGNGYTYGAGSQQYQLHQNQRRQSVSPSHRHQNNLAVPHQKQGQSRVKPKLTEDAITRSHWQRETGMDHCSQYGCRRPLNNKVGKINCRSCGRLYCDDHVSCQMKLNKHAKWDPEKGVWCRVCFNCFESRSGFNDATGTTRDLSKMFIDKRRMTLDKLSLEANLLEKRLVKLVRILLESEERDTTMKISSWISTQAAAKVGETYGNAVGMATDVAAGYIKQIKNYRKDKEQSVVAWQDDKTVSECPYCTRKFTFSLRKHHCRLCGKVVCADVEKRCSIDEIMTKESISKLLNEDIESQVTLSVRICRDCHSIVFGRREFLQDKHHKLPVVKTYEVMMEFKRGIEALLPKFQKLLDNFDDPKNPPTHDLLSEASTVRKKLLYSFQEFDTAAKRIWKMPTPSAQQAKMQANIHIAATQVLQMYMLPLKSLPNILKHSHQTALPTIQRFEHPTSNGNSNHGSRSDSLSSSDSSGQNLASTSKSVSGNNVIPSSRSGEFSDSF